MLTPLQTRAPAATPARDSSKSDAGPHPAPHPRPSRSVLPPLPVAIPVHPANDPLEAEAGAVASQAVGPAPSPGPGVAMTPATAPPSVHAAMQSSGRPLDDSTRSLMEPRLGHDLSSVRIHTGAQAQQSAKDLDAQAYTLGQDIFFDSGRYNPHSGRGQWLLAHELAHTAQQAGAGTMAVQRLPNDLASYPEAERRAIAQTTTETSVIDATFLNDVFGTAQQAGGATTTYPFGGQTAFSANIPAALQRGLTSTGAYMAGQTNLLPLGSTVTLHLDLTPFQGPNASFRFSHFTHTEPHSAAGPVLLIENVGPAPAAIASATVPSGAFTVRGQNFTAGGGWSQQQFGLLQAVLTRLPDAVITEAAGTTFALRGTGTPEEGGFYDAQRDEIVLHTNAFPATNTTFGGAEHGMYNITHELGHLLDLRRLERAWRTFNSGGQTAAGKTQLLNERSLSGSRWRAPTATDPNFTQVDDRTSVGTQAFRAAAHQDGISPGPHAGDPLTGAPTAYGNTDWQELFAESFALYVNDPALFRILRPHVFQYFQSRFPLPAAGSSASTGSSSGSGSGTHP